MAGRNNARAPGIFEAMSDSRRSFARELRP